MENNPQSGVTAPSASQQSKDMANAGATNKKFKGSIMCAIRRRSSLVGLPGSDPNERNYKIGSSIDLRTRKNLKGIDGEVEMKYMPSIIGINYTDNNFQEKVNEYWGNVSSFIPADEAFLREEARGKLLKIEYVVTGEALNARLEKTGDIEEKVELLKEAIAKDLVTITYADIPDFVLLCYALKYSRVAKDVTYLDKSPKIHFYIYNKVAAVKAKLTTIELRNKAINVFTKLSDNEAKINQLLVMFNKLPTDYDTLDDKLIALDTEYNMSTANMQKFVENAEDTDLQIKYLIKYAVTKGKLNNPANTDAYYYNQVLLGKTLSDAVLYLKDTTDDDARLIKETLTREIKD